MRSTIHRIAWTFTIAERRQRCAIFTIYSCIQLPNFRKVVPGPAVDDEKPPDEVAVLVGVPMCANGLYLNETLRTTWGFDGCEFKLLPIVPPFQKQTNHRVYDISGDFLCRHQCRRHQ